MAGWTKLLLHGVLFTGLGACTPALAQHSAGSLTVKLTDPYARPLAGAAVTLRSHAGGPALQPAAIEGGVYRFVGLEPGAYTLAVSSAQLGQETLDGIEVSAGRDVRVQVAVTLALVARDDVAAEDAVVAPSTLAIHEGACVAKVAMYTARAAVSTAFSRGPAIEIASGEADTAPIPTEQLQALPLAGRDWQSVFSGPSASAAAEEGDNQRPEREPVPILVDGVDTTLAFGGARTHRSSGPGAALVGPGSGEAGLRAVQETSGSGFLGGGRNGRGGLDTATERGGNRLHGRESLYDRQNMLGAKNPFTQWVKETAPATATTIPVFTPMAYTPENHEMTWSLSAGGPLPRKLFWFATIEGFERNDPGVSTVRHPDNFFAQPSNDEMQVLSARLGLSSANPVAEGLGAYSGLLQSLDGLLGPAARVSKRATGFARGDWVLSERQRFTLEGTAALLRAFGGGLTGVSENYGTHSYGSSRLDDQWVLARWETFLTRNLVGITQVSVGRQLVAKLPESPSVFEQSLNISDWGRLPQMTVDSRYGFTIGNPSRFGPGGYPDEHLYQAQEQFDWTHSGLQVRTGMRARHNNDATGFLRNQTGTYHYTSVENFASDALAFATFGLSGQLDPMNQHNCDQTGRVWRDTAGTLHGLGYLPCYAWYSQTMGPSNWWLSTDDWSSYVTSQWHTRRQLVASLALRWDLEQTPQPIALVDNSDLPLTQHMPSLGSQWGPQASLAWGVHESHWPVVHLGYGMFFGRTSNRTLEDALTQTGSPKGDLNFFMRPTDNLNAGGAPPFPYVLAGEPGTVVKPGAIEFGPGFHNGEAQQAVASVEETLPGRVHVDASAVASLGRRLPVTEDANIDPATNPKTITYAVVDGNQSGPIKTPQITVPFFASWPSASSSTGFAGRVNPNYQQVMEILSRANSTYEAAILRVTRNSRDGLTLHARYTFAHAADWNPNESANILRPSVFDPTNLRDEYGASNQDIRHSASVAAIYQPRWKLHGELSPIANGWMVSAIGTARSGLPYTMRTSASLAKEFDTNGTAIVALAPGINGYGGDNRVYGVGRNTYRYGSAWKMDLRLGKRFDLRSNRQLELLAESFNLFNHQNVTELETIGYSIEPGSTDGSLPKLNFLTGLKTGQTEFGQPLNINAADFYRPRQVQFGMRMRF